MYHIDESLGVISTEGTDRLDLIHTREDLSDEEDDVGCGQGTTD